MATVYILYSASADRYYTGYTKDLLTRIEYHRRREFAGSFTARYNDWVLYYTIDNLSLSTAIKIEKHIKRMKSSKYIENLKKYPEIAEKLIARYSASRGAESSRR